MTDVEIGGLTASVAMIYFIIEYSVYRSALSFVLLFLIIFGPKLTARRWQKRMQDPKELLVRPRSFASWQSGAGIPTNQTIPFLPVNEGF